MPISDRRHPLPLHLLVGASLLEPACTPIPSAPPTLAPERPAPRAAQPVEATPREVAPREASPARAEPVAPPALVEDAVVAPHFARQVLYSWTTAEQIVELRSAPVLLTRTESPTRGPSRYDQEIAERAGRGDPMAVMLRAPRFARARFAWNAPWATVAGWPTEGYGNYLLRITLRDDAWIAHLRASDATWAVRDLRDREVPLAQALAHPERIAAVYFVHDAASRRFVGPGTFALEGDTPFREYVLCNEAMIASWEFGTPAAREAVDRGIATLASLVAALESDCPRDVADPVQLWSGAREPSSIGDRYAATLAFANSLYRFEAPQLTQVRELLAQAATPTPMVHRVDPRRIPPPPRAPAPAPTQPRRRVPNGTY